MRFDMYCNPAFVAHAERYAAHVASVVASWPMSEDRRRVSQAAQNFLLQGMEKATAMCAAYTFHTRENATCH